jgi:hypothetical protein
LVTVDTTGFASCEMPGEQLLTEFLKIAISAMLFMPDDCPFELIAFFKARYSALFIYSRISTGEAG